MTKIKFCGLTRPCDIESANELKPEYIGFVFAEKSRRYISPEKAAELKKLLDKNIRAVGVFVDESPENIAALLNKGIIDIAQLHGSEDDRYIEKLRRLTENPLIKAFLIKTPENIANAVKSTADCILLDSGAGSGTVFDWRLIQKIKRPFFLAGGLSPDNIENALNNVKPYAVDISSGIETDGIKDKYKMAAITAAVRKEDTV